MKNLFLLAILILSCGSLRAYVAAPDSVVAPRDSVSGSYIWIPDSLSAKVRSVLDGKSKIVRDYSIVDRNERVLVNGDTVNLIIKERNLGRFDRGLFNFLFIPKGQWKFGLTASYGEFNSDDLKMLDLLSDFDFTGHTFAIRPSISYFIRNNVSVGLRFIYSSAKAGVGSMKVDFDEDLNFSIGDIMYRNEEYSAALTTTQYLGLGRSSRFAVFNEVELAFTSGNGSFRRPFQGEPKVTKTTYMQAQLSFSPGVCMFIMKNVSFNVSFGVFGYHIRNEKQTVNGEKLGNRFTSGANFRFNIFNINFGLGVHI